MIRLLRDDDAETYAELHRKALLDSPLAFVPESAEPPEGCPDADPGGLCGRGTVQFCSRIRRTKSRRAAGVVFALG
jgi:hypothetical protein